MSDNSIIYANSDVAFVKELGAFIRHHRLEQNKTQQTLADEAGINRTTLVEFEKGKNSNLLTFIQLLRALKQLQVLDNFHISQQISPILLAELQHKARKRARKKKSVPGTAAAKKTKSDW